MEGSCVAIAGRNFPESWTLQFVHIAHIETTNPADRLEGNYFEMDGMQGLSTRLFRLNDEKNLCESMLRNGFLASLR